MGLEKAATGAILVHPFETGGYYWCADIGQQCKLLVTVLLFH